MCHFWWTPPKWWFSCWFPHIGVAPVSISLAVNPGLKRPEDRTLPQSEGVCQAVGGLLELGFGKVYFTSTRIRCGSVSFGFGGEFMVVFFSPQGGGGTRILMVFVFWFCWGGGGAKAEGEGFEELSIGLGQSSRLGVWGACARFIWAFLQHGSLSSTFIIFGVDIVWALRHAIHQSAVCILQCSVSASKFRRQKPDQSHVFPPWHCSRHHSCPCIAQALGLASETRSTGKIRSTCRVAERIPCHLPHSKHLQKAAWPRR